jgi:hypothetical protein
LTSARESFDSLPHRNELPTMPHRSIPLILGAAALLAGCTSYAIRPVPLLPFQDGMNAAVTEPMIYRLRDSGTEVVVPAGFVTDFASTPRLMWSLLPPIGTYLQAAVVHDYLYWTQGCTRAQADRILLLAMEDNGVSAATRQIIYRGVRAGGDTPWTDNARARRLYSKFVVPDANGAIRIEPGISWEAYRAVHPPGPLDSRPATLPAYCAAAEAAAVPAS